MTKTKTIVECIVFFVVVVLGFFGLQWISAEQTAPLLGYSSSNTDDTVAQSSLQCDVLGTMDYLEYLESADDSDEVLFAGCGGFL